MIIMEIDIDSLREDLINYLGSAMMYNITAQADLIFITSCSNEELLEYALQNDFDLSNYIKGGCYEKTK